MPPTLSTSSSSSKLLRSRAGCLTCRRRKVKCDEKRPKCGKCAIKSRTCVWPDDNASGPSSQQGTSAGPLNHPLPPLNLDLSTALATATGDPFWDAFSSAAGSLDLAQLAFPTLAALSPQHVDVPTQPQPFTSYLPISPEWPKQIPPRELFYVPPDFLPKIADDVSRSNPANEFSRLLLQPDQRALLMSDPAFLQPYFPSIDERIIMRHYLTKTVHIIMAFECARRPWNPWIVIHAPLAFKHLPGVNHAADALRAAMVAVGAVHLRYAHNSHDQRGAWDIVRSAQAKVLQSVKRSIDTQNTSLNLLEKGDVELLLAALLSCTIASSLAADASWHELLTAVIGLVDRLGGPHKLMQLGSNTEMSTFRFFLEQLAIRDVFGCMTTESAPSLMNEAFSPWFFELESWSKGDDEWESIERMFGFSRGMADILAKVCNLISKVRQHGQRFSPEDEQETGGVDEPFTLRLPIKALNRLDSPTSQTSAELSEPQSTKSNSPVRAGLLREARELAAELDVWDRASNFSPFHPRTQYGNHAYRHAIRIRILREVFQVPVTDSRIQQSAAAVIELAKELMSVYGRATWMTWPIILSAFCLRKDDPSRPIALALLSEFSNHACFDLRAARSLLGSFWEDETRHAFRTPAQMANGLSGRPFLD